MNLTDNQAHYLRQRTLTGTPHWQCFRVLLKSQPSLVHDTAQFIRRRYEHYHPVLQLHVYIKANLELFAWYFKMRGTFTHGILTKLNVEDMWICNMKTEWQFFSLQRCKLDFYLTIFILVIFVNFFYLKYIKLIF